MKRLIFWVIQMILLGCLMMIPHSSARSGVFKGAHGNGKHRHLPVGSPMVLRGKTPAGP